MVVQASPIPSRIGPFAILGKLGAGGMGVVYRGISRAGERVAIKVIQPGILDSEEYRARFAQEVQALKTVNGSRVALLIDSDAEAQEPWLAMQYVHGRDLEKYVRQQGPLPPELVAILGAVLAEGLDSVHKARLLHRDLKPQNILLGPDGPLVIDFGLAVLIERRHVLTETGRPMGTAAYMAPEQARAEKQITPAADVYGLGATLLYAATGRYPYDPTGGWVAMLYKINDPDKQPHLDGVSGSLRALLSEMLRYKAPDRPTLGEVTDRLVRLLEQEHGLTAVAARQRLVELTTRGLPPLPDLPPVRPGGRDDEPTERAGPDATTALGPGTAPTDTPAERLGPVRGSVRGTGAGTPGADPGMPTLALPDREAAAVVAERLGKAYGARGQLRLSLS